MKLKILLFPCILFALGCHKVVRRDIPEANASAVFNYLWNEINTKYSFIEFKNLNWEDIKNKYQSQVYDGMEQEALFRICSNMMNELRDGHANLIAPFDVSYYYPIFLNSPQNFNSRLVLTNYLMRQGANMQSTGALDNCILDSLGIKIGYVRYNSFSEKLYTEDLDYVINKMQNCDGLILDIRSNGGGSAANVFALAGRFADSKKLAFRSFAKNGIAHDAFDEGKDLYVSPQGNKQFTKRIAILTNRGCYSATSFFTLAMKSFSYVKVIGDTTGGGLGVPNGGQLPNAWSYRFSVTKTLTPDGKNFENGIPPDITVWMQDSSVNKGIDDIIERGIMYIKSGG
ncbi:MAG TPA: S41 family peptidase [Bacteroidia bacterium]|nr:S41 family peptidase [Bacteroidia bacterium]